MLASFIFGVVDALKGAGLADGLPNWLTHMPFSEQGLAWLVPSLIVLVGAFIYDRLLGKSQEAIA